LLPGVWPESGALAEHRTDGEEAAGVVSRLGGRDDPVASQAMPTTRVKEPVTLQRQALRAHQARVGELCEEPARQSWKFPRRNLIEEGRAASGPPRLHSVLDRTGCKGAWADWAQATSARVDRRDRMHQAAAKTRKTARTEK